MPKDLNVNADIKTYFEAILPDYDKDRVHASDMKKIIKWYVFLDEKKLLKPKAEKKEKEKEEATATEKESKS